MGLDVYVHDRAKAVAVEDDGDTYHEWKDRYDEVDLRSSYNDSGFNHIVESLVGKYGFYYIFEPLKGEDEEYEFPVRGREDVLRQCRERAVEIKTLLETAAEADEFFSCFDIDMPRNKDLVALDEKTALGFFRDQKARHKDGTGFSTYTTGTGFFSMTGIEVFAIMPGLKQDIFAKINGNADGLVPTTYVVVKHSKDSAGYYIDQADRAVKMCDLLLEMLQDPETDPVIIWSA